MTTDSDTGVFTVDYPDPAGRGGRSRETFPGRKEYHDWFRNRFGREPGTPMATDSGATTQTGPAGPGGGYKSPSGGAEPTTRAGAPATSEVTLNENNGELRSVGSWDENSHATVETHGTDASGQSQGWMIDDVVRGSNPSGTGAEMVVQVGRATGYEQPTYLLGEVGNQPTRDVAAQGLPPDGSVLNGLRQRIAQQLGGQAQPSTWADANGNPISPQEAQARLLADQPIYLRTDISYPAAPQP